MSVNLGFSRARGSSVSLEKFIQARKNLSKPPPRLWPDDQQPRAKHFDEQGRPLVELHHPMLHKLESVRSLDEFDQVLTHMVVSGLLQYSLVSGRVIKKLCTCFNSVSRAVSVFDSINEPDAFMGNTILRCFLNSKHPLGAMSFYYEQMVGRCVLHNHYTFPLVAKVCTEIGSVKEGEKIHALVSKLGFESDLFVRNSLIYMYSVCGHVRLAHKVFDVGHMVDLISWNSMIAGYVKNDQMDIARELFDEMPEKDVFAWNSMLCGYARLKEMETARYLFENMPDPDAVSWNCMINGYATVGNVTMAREYFDRMPRKNVISWNAILALYVRIKDYTECLRLFEIMRGEGDDCKPNKASLMSFLTACANLRQLDAGKLIHSYITSSTIKPDVLLSTALLTMYAKCGAMDMAREVFDGMSETNIVSWNSMIMGYGMNGHGEKAVEMLLDMGKNSNIVPNGATLVCLLSACANSGMVLEGWWLYDLLTRICNLETKVEHHGCMVDLLGQAGLSKDSEELMKETQSALSSCWTLENPNIGEILARRLIRLHPTDIGPYVLLSYINAVNGRWEEVEKVRRIMNEKKLQIPAVASKGSTSNCMTRIIYSMLCEIGTELKISKHTSAINS